MKMTRLVPMLPVRDLAASVAFYEKLGFTVVARNDDWGWARLAFDDCDIMLDRSIRLHEGVPREAVLYLYPDDIGTYHAMTRAKGVDIPDLTTTFYGMIEFRIEDPDGNRLWIGQPSAAEG